MLWASMARLEHLIVSAECTFITTMKRKSKGDKSRVQPARERGLPSGVAALERFIICRECAHLMQRNKSWNGGTFFLKKIK